MREGEGKNMRLTGTKTGRKTGIGIGPEIETAVENGAVRGREKGGEIEEGAGMWREKRRSFGE